MGGAQPDAVSAQSGVSGDPKQSTVRKTALGARFWCDSIERSLCVDIKAVDSYAAKALRADLVIVVADTAKYGGAGYGSTRSPTSARPVPSPRPRVEGRRHRPHAGGRRPGPDPGPDPGADPRPGLERHPLTSARRSSCPPGTGGPHVCEVAAPARGPCGPRA
ncbi:M64 family metallopeptidase, partial [Kitasatospora sp. NPDC059327]|uniref:M64 family metallopeptidase n=1 Tax=Kitasatospora sp. NPDC059327 TaxID=3346803 RepID=UPI0036A22B9C